MLARRHDGELPEWNRLIGEISQMEVRPRVLFIPGAVDLGATSACILRRCGQAARLGLRIVCGDTAEDEFASLIGLVIGAHQALENEMRSVRIKTALAARPVPPGFARGESSGRSVPARDGTAKLVQFIFSDFADGYSLAEVAARANRRDSRQGLREWTHGRIRRLLCSPTYVPSTERGFPPIVDPAVAERVRARLGRGRRRDTDV